MFRRLPAIPMPRFGSLVLLLVACAAFGAAIAHTGRSEATAQEESAAPPPSAASYPYGSAAFDGLVSDSYAVAGEGAADEFHQWLRNAYGSSGRPVPGTPGKDLAHDLSLERTELQGLADPVQRSGRETELARWAHAFIKKAIPRFSLDRGYEFRNVVKYGERQCLLQSVLIAGLLQSLGCDAGIAMVCRNDKGEVSNNGHVTVLLGLADDAALLVDASDPTPFVKHQGLLVSAQGYRYVNPIYAPGSDRIERFRIVDTRARLAVAKVSGLDIAFVRSQFWYYRGERVPGGVTIGARTAAGLAESRKCLEESVRGCPGNSLAVYMLGRTLLYQGHTDEARKRFTTAEELYAGYGWVPDGLREALAATQPRPAAVGRRR
jgi:hypothetical protein